MGPRFSHPNGLGGTEFSSAINERGVEKVIVRTGKYVDAIQLVFRDGTRTDRHGGWGGSHHEFTVPPGEHINRVVVWCDWGTASIKFYTNRNNSSSRWGGPGGQFRELKAPEGQQLIGVHGRSGDLLDKVEFVWGPLEKITSIKLMLVSVFVTYGDSQGQIQKTISTKKGHRSDHQASSNVQTIGAMAEREVGVVFQQKDCPFELCHRSIFEAATEQSYEEFQENMVLDIDLSMPGAWYRAVVHVKTSSGDIHSFSSDALVQSLSPLSQTVYSRDIGI